MADNFTVNVGESFNMDDFVNEVTEQYQAKGFKVQAIKSKKSVKLVFERNCGGINMLLGLGLGISATCSMMGKENDTMNVNFSDGDWMGKIIGLAVGWFMCLVPFITSLIGVSKQLGLPKEIGNDMQMIISNME